MDCSSTAWAEIDAILASIDPNRASWIARLESADRQEMSNSGLLDFLVSLEDWAALNRLEEVLPSLLAHGFDCASFINGVLSDSDLLELGLRSSALRRRVLTAVKELPCGVLAVAESLSSGATADWLLQRLRLARQLGCEFAAAASAGAAECGCGGGGDQMTVDELTCVTDAELRQRFNVRKLGHRRRILCCLDNAPALLPQRRPPSAPTASTGVAALNGGPHRRQGSNLSAISSVSSSAKSTSASACASAAAATVAAVSFAPVSMPTTGSASPSIFDSPAPDSDDSWGAGDHRAAVAPRPGRAAAVAAAAAAALSSAAAMAQAARTDLLPRRELLPGVSRSWVSTRSGGVSGGGGGGRGTDVGEDDADDAMEAPAPSSIGRRLLQLPRSRSSDFLAGGGGDGDSRHREIFRPLVRAGWPHHPDVLLRDSFSYSVSYLGFRPLVDHTDQAEISQVMQTFRCKSADILKLPRIRLTVCYRGVKFINPDNDMVITEHRITEIYFASQDNTRRANFAYVTKDSVNSVHYCHCFASHSPETAVMIIQTLSEACGLANQLIEFNQLRRSRQRQQMQIQRRGRKRSRRT